MTAKGAVACGHPETAKAAQEILQDGGNAFDAILAAYAAATVAETVLSSLGGGGFLLARPHDGDPWLYDFFVDTPLRTRPEAELDFFPVHADFGTVTQEFHIGLGATATPGGVKGLFTIHEDLGSLPMGRILEPAVRLARQGYQVREIDAFLFSVVEPILRARPAVKALHCDAQDRLLTAGAVMRQPELADTLIALAEEGAGLFYDGELGHRLVEACRSQGGQLSEADLKHYRVIRRQPLARNCGHARVYSNPPPSAGGLLIAFALDLLEPQNLGAMTPAQRVALVGRAMALANQVRREQRLETLLPDETSDPAALLADPVLLARYRNEVAPFAPATRGTTHISVIDSLGNLASMTLSNGEGCGEFLPGSGIILNNMLGEEDLNPAGFHAGPPGTRLSSMMAPTLAILPDGTEAALGSGGSNRIRSAILQVLLELIEGRATVEQAVSAPRLHVERGKANLETGLPQGLAALLEDQGLEIVHWPEKNLFFGGVHSVLRSPGGALSTAGDPRRGGVGMIAD